MKILLTTLTISILMLTGCAKTADILRPAPTPIIPIGAGVLASDNVRFVGSEGDISGHRFDTAASAYASEVVRNFFKEQQALIDTHCPLKVDEPLPTTDFFLVYFPSRTERDQFVSNLPGERVIWYADVVSIVINEEVVNYSAEISLIITEACHTQTSLISDVQPPKDDLLYDETGMCSQKAIAFIVSDGYAMGWDGCRWHHGKSVHYVAYVNGPYHGTAYAVHKETETQKLYILRDGLKVYLFH